MKKMNTLTKQRLMGVVMLIITVLAIVLTGDATSAFFTAPIGLGLLLSKEVFIYED